MKKIFFGIVLLLLLPVFVSATDYYIDASDGDDNNNGLLPSNAWKTIGKANQELRPGDTVFIRGGTYDETISPSRSGTAGNPITYKNYPGETPVIDRSRIITGWTHFSGNVYRALAVTDYGLWQDTYEEADHYCDMFIQESVSGVNGPGKYYIGGGYVYAWLKDGDNPNNHIMRTYAGMGAKWDDKDYIILDGIHMRWVQRGVNVGNSDHCEFKNLNIQYASGMGIWLLSNSNYNKVLNNKIFHVGSWYRDEGDGIYISSNSHHNLIEGNDISVIAHNPITTYGTKNTAGIGPHHNIIQNNVVYDSGSSGLNPNVDPYSEVWRNNIAYHNTGAGLQTDANNNIIYKNIFYDNGMDGITVYTTGGRTASNNKFFHNVMYYNGDWNPLPNEIVAGFSTMEYPTGAAADDNIFKNNIIYEDAGDYDLTLSNLRNNVIISNIIHDSSGTEIRCDWGGTYGVSWWENNYPSNFIDNLDVNPEFVSASSHNFNLQSSSPAIDQGEWLTYTTSTDSGNQIHVQDASYFIDGYGIVEGDLIQLQYSTQTARITNVDYNNNIITVDRSLSWDVRDGVSFAYSGNAPDIGAFEYRGIPPPPPPPPPPNGDELVVNGDFSSWSNDNPVGWVMEYSEDADSYVSQSSGRCRIVDIDGSGSRITQNILTPGKQYRLTYTINTVNNGAIKIGSDAPWKDIAEDNTPSTKTVDFTAVGNIFSIGRSGVPSDVIIDDVSVKEIINDSVPGDLNNDGDIDFNDLILVAADFGKTSGFNSRADTNNDNEIDIFDIVYIASRI